MAQVEKAILGQKRFAKLGRRKDLLYQEKSNGRMAEVLVAKYGI
jgi:hypothetical protein